MSSPAITNLWAATGQRDLPESVRPNFAALLVIGLIALIWGELSPIWLPFVTGILSLLEPIFSFFCEVGVFLAALFLLGFSLAAVGMLLGGAVPKSYL